MTAPCYVLAEEVFLEIKERAKEKQKANPKLTHEEAVKQSIHELLREGNKWR